MARPSLFFLASAILCATVVLLPATPRPSRARSDVPEEIARRSNPVTLSPSRVKYFAKQYRAKCARCHGAEGDGAGAESAGQAVPPADFTDAAAMAGRSDGQLFYQILMGGGDRCAMPAFGPESDHGWSEKKVWEMVAFVRRFAAPPSGSEEDSDPPGDPTN